MGNLGLCSAREAELDREMVHDGVDRRRGRLGRTLGGTAVVARLFLKARQSGAQDRARNELQGAALS